MQDKNCAAKQSSQEQKSAIPIHSQKKSPKPREKGCVILTSTRKFPPEVKSIQF